MDAPAHRLWRLLVEVDRWPAWGPSVAGAELDTPRVHAGSRGTVRTALGVSLPFEVTDLDEGRSWSWSVAGVPATGHSVEARGEGCRVTFTVPWWAPGYLVVCALALSRLERLAAETDD